MGLAEREGFEYVSLYTVDNRYVTQMNIVVVILWSYNRQYGCTRSNTHHALQGGRWRMETGLGSA
jgi:hypothetical protein